MSRAFEDDSRKRRILYVTQMRVPAGELRESGWYHGVYDLVPFGTGLFYSAGKFKGMSRKIKVSGQDVHAAIRLFYRFTVLWRHRT